MIQLGDRVRDRISGFEGIVVGISEWLYGCRRPVVQPTTLTDGKPTDSQSFDEPQLELIEKAVIVVRVVNPPDVREAALPEKTGGPRATPSRRPTPSRS
jgi:hypothetical protein